MRSRLITMLLPRGHRVRALARQASLGRVPEGAMPVVGDALDAASVAAVENPQPRGQIQIVDVVGIRSDGHDDSQSKSAGAEEPSLDDETNDGGCYLGYDIVPCWL